MDSSEARTGSASPASASGGTFSRLLRGLTRTRDGLIDRIKDLVQGSTRIDEALLEQVETLLLLSDVGPSLTSEVVRSLKQSSSGKEVASRSDLLALVRQELKKILSAAPAGASPRPA